MKTAIQSAIFGFSLSLFTLLATAEPLIVAHRGASAYAPENTIPAFELAWKQGADAIEGDFRLTKDGHIVCIHDGNTKKVAGKNLEVHLSNLKDLQSLDVGVGRGAAFKGTRIPTFKEVVATVPDGKKIYIEIKCGPEIVPVLFKQVGESALKPEQVVFISFKQPVIQALKQLQPDCKAYLLYSFKKNDPSLVELVESLKGIGADGLSSNTKISGSMITGLQKAGFEWHVWTINEREQAKRMKGLGALSITTDKPDLLKKD